jgi:cardiolipin synthase
MLAVSAWVLAGIIAGTVAATGVVTIIVLNFTTGERKIKEPIPTLYTVGDDQFVRSIGSLLIAPILPGNRVKTLLNGDEIFPAMLEAIRSATTSITFETYIYWSGDVGRQFAEALAERARRGVAVHVLLDWVGSQSMETELLETMKKAGVEVEKYHPLKWYHLWRMNNRTHRKLLVVDGRVGFTGGVGIADQWSGHAQDPEHWRDTHYRIEGPAVALMQAVFIDNWMKTTAAVLHGERYFPAIDPQQDSPDGGTCRVQITRSSNNEGAESARLMYLLAIAAAERSCLVANAYFVPDDLSVQTLVDARTRGVDVQILVPGRHMDAPATQAASRSRWGKLLEAGITIHEYEPTMFHCKIMIIDELWCTVGSTNFDTRSFRLNDEANASIFDQEFARKQAEIFRQDRGRARQITLEMWRRRPWREKVKDRLAGLLRSQV